MAQLRRQGKADEMIPQKQLNRHCPENGVFGDCHRTAIACLLDMRPEEVPNWSEKHWQDVDAWMRAEKEFLASKGLSSVTFAYNSDLESLLAAMGITNPSAFYMITGKSRNGTHHVVIAKGSEIVWDPAQDDSGIVGPCEDGLYWLDFLVPAFMVQK